MFISLRHLECILEVPKTCRVGLGHFMVTERGGSPCVLSVDVAVIKDPVLMVVSPTSNEATSSCRMLLATSVSREIAAGKPEAKENLHPTVVSPVRSRLPRVLSRLTWLLVRNQTSLMQGLSLGSGFHPRHPAVSTSPVLEP